ncbi:MAG TPA: sugar phosphate isomerase/epimerase family protein [Candidatus Methylacidiphilales bacterium]|nr:sugar phosphate isomerase/epimerase family protein [Candidatus Methylacidiphilales bacterium]
MFDLYNQLGIKSYSFRHIKENADVAAAVKECGVNAIDLSACHINYDDVAQQEQAIATYKEAGVSIVGIGVVGLKNDEAFNRRYFEFAKRAGCGVVSCSFDPQDHDAILAMVDRFTGEYGVRAAIHNHGGYHWMGNASILKYLFARTSNRIGLCIDTAWCLQAGEKPLAWLDTFGDRLYAIHFKDFEFARTGGTRDTIVGDGALDLPAFLEKFLALPFEGPAVVEYEGSDSVVQSAKCVAAIRKLIPSPVAA